MTFRIHFDWVEAAPCTDSLAQSTMAALTIEVKGAVVTSVLDRRTRSCRDHVVTPLGCVAQWLVGNWWRLFHEVADSRPRSDFAEAHDLACVGEGYLLPSLVIAPTPDKMSLHWRRQRPLHSAIEFTEQGEALVDRVALETEFGRLLDAVLDRLDNDDPTARLLCNEWNAIQAVDADEREFCRAAALLGRDPFATPQELAARIVDFWNRTAPPLREDALATANGQNLALLADWLADTAQCVDSFGCGAWESLHRALQRSSAQEPYRRGYDLARAARAQLQPSALRYDIAATGPEAIPCAPIDPPAGTSIQGLVAAQSPACAVANGRETAQRFLQARALGDYLGRTAPGPAILSGLATDRQAQTRAFAAEFLVPAETLRKQLRSDPVPLDEVDDLALAFNVSSYVVRHQIENHNLGRIADW